VNPRAQAARFLAEVLRGEKSLAALPAYPLSPQDRALLQELCYGVCRFYHRHDAILRQLLPKPLKAKDADVQALLHLGLYQLFCTRVPDHAAIGATVEAAATLKKPWAKGLINGVLRNAQRQRETFTRETPENPQSHYSHPQWLIDALKKAWPYHWQAILQANNQHPTFTLRVNRRQTSREAYLQRLLAAGIEAAATPFSPDGITLPQAVAVTQLPDFAEGAVSVQDEAAQLAAGLLELAPGQRVLDACCAPGGKTGHLLEREPGLDAVVGLDVEASRMGRVRDNLARLGLTATLKVADAARLEDWWDGRPFDRILLDAPCSATGVIRRHPDIKLLRRPDDIDKLAALQQQLLRALWSCLKPGGLLLYATCSILPKENEAQVAGFVAETADAQPQPLDVPWGLPLEIGRQLFPSPGGHDGFYYALLRKRVS
jgi:16S rRNA (cytosine967-C5)-methyltransferase